MSWIVDFYRSTLGKKAVMAASGVVLFGFVLGHMIGNLKLYRGTYAEGEHAGAYRIDVYGEGLREVGGPFLGYGEGLWLVRTVLIVAVLLHVHAAWALTRRSNAARTRGYAAWRPQASNYASRTMRWGGVIVLLFVVYHLMHLTWGTVHQDFIPGAVYHNVVVGFQNPVVSGFYILANLALGLHLYHGLWSMFQTLGGFGPRLDPFRRGFAKVFALVITLGNVSFPIAVLAGLVSLPS